MGEKGQESGEGTGDAQQGGPFPFSSRKAYLSPSVRKLPSLVLQAPPRAASLFQTMAVYTQDFYPGL